MEVTRCYNCLFVALSLVLVLAFSLLFVFGGVDVGTANAAFSPIYSVPSVTFSDFSWSSNFNQFLAKVSSSGDSYSIPDTFVSVDTVSSFYNFEYYLQAFDSEGLLTEYLVANNTWLSNCITVVMPDLSQDLGLYCDMILIYFPKPAAPPTNILSYCLIYCSFVRSNVNSNFTCDYVTPFASCRAVIAKQPNGFVLTNGTYLFGGEVSSSYTSSIPKSLIRQPYIYASNADSSEFYYTFAPSAYSYLSSHVWCFPYSKSFFGDLVVSNFNSSSLISSSYSDGYSTGYNEGNSLGYNSGFTAGNQSGYDSGYTAASEALQSQYESQLKSQTENAYQAGKTAGIAQANDYTFLGLLGAVVDAPVSAFRNLLSVNFLGTDLFTLVLSLLFVSIVIVVVRKIL